MTLEVSTRYYSIRQQLDRLVFEAGQARFDPPAGTFNRMKVSELYSVIADKRDAEPEFEFYVTVGLHALELLAGSEISNDMWFHAVLAVAKMRRDLDTLEQARVMKTPRATEVFRSELLSVMRQGGCDPSTSTDLGEEARAAFLTKALPALLCFAASHADELYKGTQDQEGGELRRSLFLALAQAVDDHELQWAQSRGLSPR